MTVKRQTSHLEEQIATLGVLVEQYQDDFALSTEEARLLTSSYEHLQFLANGKKTAETRTYAEECAAYYKKERASNFFNDQEAGQKIFEEIASAYTHIYLQIKNRAEEEQ